MGEMPMMKADFGIDLDEVRRVIDAADVLVVRFSVTDRRLLVDVRTNNEQGPMIRVVPRAGSAEERFRSLKMLRPRFPVPERIMTFHWPRHARALAEAGVWDDLVRRLVALGWPDTAAQCDAAYRELLNEELVVEVSAILGSDSFHTKWSSDGHSDD
jgi:hypothetical protein